MLYPSPNNRPAPGRLRPPSPKLSSRLSRGDPTRPAEQLPTEGAAGAPPHGLPAKHPQERSPRLSPPTRSHRPPRPATAAPQRTGAPRPEQLPDTRPTPTQTPDSTRAGDPTHPATRPPTPKDPGGRTLALIARSPTARPRPARAARQRNGHTPVRTTCPAPSAVPLRLPLNSRLHPSRAGPTRPMARPRRPSTAKDNPRTCPPAPIARVVPPPAPTPDQHRAPNAAG